MRPSNEFKVPRDLLDKYNTAGPRYTSYPTAPEWQDGWGDAEGFEVLAQNNAERADVPLSLYVHLPFCHKLCFFCGCNMLVTQKQDLVTSYLDALELEIDRVSRRFDHARRPVVQIHWGGGTPTYLKPDQLARVFNALSSRFNVAQDAEISLELHPAVTSDEQLVTLKQLGFNRVSMGIQDFDAKVQQAVNRIQPYELTRDLIARCRELGFDSVNTDLMYGLPHQGLAGFEATLDLVLGIRPDRIALFNYAHVPWLKKHMEAIKEADLPTPDEKLRIFEMAIGRLLDVGYRYIGMDHFALPDDELSRAQEARTLRRNFMGYTTCADSDLIAFGCSSISDMDRAYTQNERNVQDYIAAIGSRELATKRGMRLSDDDRLRRDVINDLFCNLYVDKQAVAAKHGVAFDATFAKELAALAPLAADGLVELAPDHLHITPRGQILLRNVAMVFDAYLDKRPASERRFSKTV
ncbi:MAG: oxygen-independent coproporphyrinogen oxidase [Cyanobacteria bacterium RYN_339]|nr:oxygen-independent coproporphyrinogen oxidase [Cyanobacteria bacterium RYN_339]